MKYNVICRDDQLSRKLAESFHKKATLRMMEIDEDSPEIVISIGGDGTMLQAIHHYIEKLDQTAFVGIHTGHLGFYTDWQPAEIDSLIDLMSTAELTKKIVTYPVAKLEVKTDQETSVFYALNEFTLKGLEGTLVASIYINDHPFEMFRGDGIVISTPTGSTAYNKSLGGAIIHPSLPSIQIAEIASINNRVYRTLGSSMILPKHHHCDVFPDRHKRLELYVDHQQFEYDDIVSLQCSVSNRSVRFARYRPFPFWNRVREAFIGKYSSDSD